MMLVDGNRILASALIFGVATFGSVAVAMPEEGRESLSALSARMNDDVALTQLYARHFNRTSSDVRAYIKSLTPSTLKTDTVLTVYALKGGAEIRPFLAGATVFVDSKERPILDAYGNPLVKPGDPTQDEAQTKDEDDDGAPAGALGSGVGTGTLVLGIVGVGGANPLVRHVLPDLGVVGVDHLAHPALAQHGPQRVAAGERGVPARGPGSLHDRSLVRRAIAHRALARRPVVGVHPPQDRWTAPRPQATAPATPIAVG